MCLVTSEQPRGFSPLVSGPAFPTHIQRDATSAPVNPKARGWDFLSFSASPRPALIPALVNSPWCLSSLLQVCLRVSCVMTVAAFGSWITSGSRDAPQRANERISGRDSAVCFARLTGLDFGTRSGRAPQVFV